MNPDELTLLAKRADDPFERALLRAAQRERAPEGADRRVLAVLGVSGVAGVGAIGGVFSRYASRIGWKGVIVSAAIGASIIGVSRWAVTREASPSSVEQALAPAAAPVVAAPAAPSTAEEPRAETMPSTRVEDLPSSRPSSVQTRSPVSAGASARAANDTEPGSLAREVALVEEARAALARGDTTAALRSLDAHDREFPFGTLGPEARVLRIEALVRAGGEHNRARADRLGDAFLAEHPSGPHARRVRAVLGRN